MWVGVGIIYMCVGVCGYYIYVCGWVWVLYIYVCGRVHAFTEAF